MSGLEIIHGMIKQFYTLIVIMALISLLFGIFYGEYRCRRFLIKNKLAIYEFNPMTGRAQFVCTNFPATSKSKK